MSIDPCAERGAASILAIGIAVGAAWLAAMVGAFGSAYVAHAELQQAADLAAGVIRQGAGDEPIERARVLARLNGARSVDVEPVAGGRQLRISLARRMPPIAGFAIAGDVHAEAVVEPAAVNSGGGGSYEGPLVLVHGIRLCPGAAASFAAMHDAAQRDGIWLTPTSGWRSVSEQAALFAALGPAIAAPPGASRHHDGTEVDISVGPAGSGVHRWLAAHAPTYGFVQRYSWEPWHWGSVRGC